MVKLDMKDKPLVLMVNGELFGVDEILENVGSTKIEQLNGKFLTIKATDITGQRKVTIRLDSRLLNILKNGTRKLYYIH
ncbi:hypothetical protein DRO69_05495 [Candidatus Bathyarchaeota archaeon]|nr:MAG: hypothetical protein DRO69_05495 [Candidatus Bathyarchaeota archaeon]